MTKDEFIAKMHEIEIVKDRAVKKLLREYAEKNNPHKIGDVIEDHIGKGRIKSIGYHKRYMSEFSECLYLCDNLLRSGEISKKEPERGIYQSNLLKGDQKC